MAENVLGLVLLLIYSEHSKIIPEILICRVNVTKRYHSKAALEEEPPSISSRTTARLKLIVAPASIRISTVFNHLHVYGG